MVWCSMANFRRSQSSPLLKLAKLQWRTSVTLAPLMVLARRSMHHHQQRRRKHLSLLRALQTLLQTSLRTSSLRQLQKAMRPLVAAQPVQHLQGRILPRLPPSISAMRAQTKVLAMLGASALLQTGQASRERAKALLLDPRQVT